MVNEVASVWVFLDGLAISHLDTMCIPIRTIDLQKGILKCGVTRKSSCVNARGIPPAV